MMTMVMEAEWLASDTPEHKKARGAFFTPEDVSNFLSTWAIRSKVDRVLEPSAGEAAFLLSATRRLTALGAALNSVSLDGVEIHAASAARARSLVGQVGAKANIVVGDFLRLPTTPVFDAVVGNPPYIRYQDFTGDDRRAAQKAALAQGVRLTKLASSWAAFVVHSSAYLKPAGRLGLVVPAELLAANYAAEVRTFLMTRFNSVTLVLFEEQVFPGVSTEAVLLMAEGCGGTDHIRVHQVRNPRMLGDQLGVARSFSTGLSSKWTKAMSPVGAIEIGDELITSGAFATLAAWGKARLGAVTGKNEYFLLSPERVKQLRIPSSELLPVSPPGSRHLRSLRMKPTDLLRLGELGQATQLFYPQARPSSAAARYIKSGEAQGVHTAYKCRARSPSRLRSLGLPLAVASVNSATMLGAETVGRAYGGGILKLEPGESVHLPLPSIELVSSYARQLRELVAPMNKLLKEGKLLLAAELVDDLLLRAGGGLGDDEVREIREALAGLALRRVTRRAPARESTAISGKK